MHCQYFYGSTQASTHCGCCTDWSDCINWQQWHISLYLAMDFVWLFVWSGQSVVSKSNDVRNIKAWAVESLVSPFVVGRWAGVRNLIIIQRMPCNLQIALLLQEDRKTVCACLHLVIFFWGGAGAVWDLMQTCHSLFLTHVSPFPQSQTLLEFMHIAMFPRKQKRTCFRLILYSSFAHTQAIHHTNCI